MQTVFCPYQTISMYFLVFKLRLKNCKKVEKFTTNSNFIIFNFTFQFPTRIYPINYLKILHNKSLLFEKKSIYKFNKDLK